MCGIFEAKYLPFIQDDHIHAFRTLATECLCKMPTDAVAIKSNGNKSWKRN